MPKFASFNLPSLNLRVSPFLQGNNAVLHALNVERDSIGAYKKRPGYDLFLGTTDNSAIINSLFSWTRNNGDTYLYKAQGSVIYHSVQGTGDWTISPGGTITTGSKFGHTVLDDVLIGGDGILASRHSTTGTNFSDTSGAPLALYWAEYQSRVWAATGTAISGTATDMVYSSVGTATDWSTDSSSIRIPGAGRLNSLWKAGDRLIATKDTGNMFRWDGFSLVDMATNLGPSSPFSIGNIEDTRVYLNRLGYYGFTGGKPQIISEAIRRQIYNNDETGIEGGRFETTPAIAHRYSYYSSVGTITDDLMGLRIPSAIQKYDFQLDEWTNWQFKHRPEAFGTFIDESGNNQMIFGDQNGQTYKLTNSLSDNGSPIEVKLIGFIHGGSLEDKKWSWIRATFNPGTRAKLAIALSDTFTGRSIKWQEVGEAKDGVVEYRFPSGSRAKFCFWKISESSTITPFQLYGLEFDAEEILH